VEQILLPHHPKAKQKEQEETGVPSPLQALSSDLRTTYEVLPLKGSTHLLIALPWGPSLLYVGVGVHLHKP
jgi:hypothetical protein